MELTRALPECEAALGRFRALVFAKSSRPPESAVGKAELREAERQYLANALEFDPGQIIALAQTHSDKYHIVNSEAQATPYAEGDALFSREDLALVVRTADCLPLFFALEQIGDQSKAGASNSMHGIVHAGWRGMASRIIYKTLMGALQEISQAGAAQVILHYAIGPCASGRVYEVGPEVSELFRHVSPTGNSQTSLLDLAMEAHDQVRQAASDISSAVEVVIECNESIEGCTMQENVKFYSHRRKDQGRNLNVIVRT